MELWHKQCEKDKDKDKDNILSFEAHVVVS
jgi:hypothetical protein